VEQSSKPNPFNDLLSEAERADIEGVSVRTLQRERAERRGPPYIKLGRRVFYRLEAYRAWLIAQEQEQPRAGEARQ